ncbi:MAG: hypothetical protein H8E59_06310 [Actinobacteria bacterium]|nr:hypothetical protein [Actinomycetota bacterium]
MSVSNRATRWISRATEPAVDVVDGTTVVAVVVVDGTTVVAVVVVDGAPVVVTSTLGVVDTTDWPRP